MSEMGMKELITVIYKRKWLLICFTAACMVASAFFSCFVAKPSYSAKIIFSVEPINMQSEIIPGSIVMYDEDSNTAGKSFGLDNKILAPVIKQFKYPNYDLNVMTNIINSQIFRDKAFDELKLDRRISFQATCNKDAKQITVVAASGSQDGLTNACKTVFEYFIKYIKTDLENQLDRNNDILAKGLDYERENIEKYKKELNAFTTSFGDAGLLESIPEKLTEYREIMNNYTLANQAFDAYKLVEKELDIIKRSDIGALLNASLLTQDVAPLKTSPRVGLNVILAAAAGFMLCFAAAVLMEFLPKRLNRRGE